MTRLSLLPCLALLAALPLAAQAPAEEARPVTSGARVTVTLRAGDGERIPGIVVSASGDTLRVVSPEIGLAELPFGEIGELQAPGSSRGEMLKYAAAIAGVSAGAGLGSVAGGDEFLPAFMNTAIVLAAMGGVLYAREGPPRAPTAVDLSNGLPGGGVQPGRGALVRITTPTLPRTAHRLFDFTADTLYLAAPDGRAPLPRAELTGLQVSLGRDWDRGFRTGTRIGAIGGGLLLGGGMALQGGWGLLLSPFGFGMGMMFGGTVGGFAGHIFAPHAWSDVPLGRP